MKQTVILILLLVGALHAGGGQARAQDEVRYHDPAAKKEMVAPGTIQEESPAGIVFKPAVGASREIPAGEIVDVNYDVPAALTLEYRHARADERRNPAEALKDYQELLPKLAGEKYARAARHIQFKIAMNLARLAEEDPARTALAIEALERFKKEQAGSWQLLPCARALARLKLQNGDSAGARRTFEELAAVPGISNEVKQEADLMAVEALISGKQIAEAQKRLQALSSSVPTDSSQAIRVRIEQAHCLGASGKMDEAAKQLETLISQTEDKNLKARAYNVLGDCYQQNAREKDAMWAYLWVDVIYHQDRREHVRAMEQLAKIFDDQGNKERARIYHDKLKQP
jgi:hypothetical protein